VSFFEAWLKTPCLRMQIVIDLVHDLLLVCTKAPQQFSRSGGGSKERDTAEARLSASTDGLLGAGSLRWSGVGGSEGVARLDRAQTILEGTRHRHTGPCSSLRKRLWARELNDSRVLVNQELVAEIDNESIFSGRSTVQRELRPRRLGIVIGPRFMPPDKEEPTGPGTTTVRDSRRGALTSSIGRTSPGCKARVHVG
jgi:hypothetical protein